MVKCSKAEVRRLKTALRWKIPVPQRQRIQMVLLRAATSGRVPIGAQHGRMRFMRPKRASSTNMMRRRRPRRGARQDILLVLDGAPNHRCSGVAADLQKDRDFQRQYQRKPARCQRTLTVVLWRQVRPDGVGLYSKP